MFNLIKYYIINFIFIYLNALKNNGSLSTGTTRPQIALPWKTRDLTV